MIKFYLLLISILCFSCHVHQHGYLGSTFTPTKNVDVFVDVSTIKKPYTIIGKSFTEMDSFTNLERIQQKAIEVAKQKGANAILFQDYQFQDVGTVQTVSKRDSSSSSSVRVRTTTTPVVTTRLDILFLKYD
jgi:hypothetical protein